MTLTFQGNVLRAQVEDDGRVFDVEEAIRSKDKPRGLGLLGMKERVKLLNGTFAIRSRLNGGGTEIDVEIPLNYEVRHG